MKLWQTTWLPTGELILWAEDVSRAATSPSGNEHPFACSHETLEADLDAIEVFADRTIDVHVLYPTDDRGPIPSPQHSHQDEEARLRNASLQAWSVPALAFDPLPGIGFLTSLPEEMPQGIRIDDSVLYWLEATKLLLDVMTSGKFLPNLSRIDGTYHARWLPIISEDIDADRFSTLVHAMPAICRSVTDGMHDAPQPVALLESFIQANADGMIRSFLKEVDFTEQCDADVLDSTARIAVSWLQALTAKDPVLTASAFEIQKLEQRLRSWSSSVLAAATKHRLQTCFRLQPPTETDEPKPEPVWRLEILIRSELDESKVISPSNPTTSEIISANSLIVQSIPVPMLICEDIGSTTESSRCLSSDIRLTQACAISST